MRRDDERHDRGHDAAAGDRPAGPSHDHHPREPGYPEHPETEPHGPHPGHEDADHDRHAGHSVAMFRTRFWICLALTVPILVYSHEVQEWFGFTPPEFPGSGWIAAVLGTVVYAYGGAVFLRGAAGELRHRRPGMMTLISVAITAAFAYSLADALGLAEGELWWELSTLVVVMLLGHWIEMRAIGRARGALRELARLLPDTAERVRDGGVETVPVSALRPGDVVLVRPGGRVPADGEVAEGRSSVNEALITGESRPVAKEENDEVIGGTVNGEGSLRVRVTKTGDASTLGGIMRLVSEAQASRSRAQDLADRAAFVLTLVALGGGAITLAAWLAAGAPAPFALERTVAVLVIACPHALGLAIPLVVAISTTIGARSGLLVRERRALELARVLDVVVFDKTGTLTLGELGVTGVHAADGIAEDDALALAAAAEADSEHHLARAVVWEAERRGLPQRGAEEFRAIPGKGVRARVDGARVHVGQPALLRDLGIEPPDTLRREVEQAESRGESAVYVAVEDRVEAAITLADVVRPESREAVDRLRAAGIDVAMLTGDSEAVARAVAEDLGITTWFARVAPDEKARRVAELRADGTRRVAMVGDGVNDAPALVAADVGIAIGAGTNVAVEAGDIVLVRNDPRDVARLVDLSRASYRKMLQNLAWATGYNIVALPIAAGVLAGRGIVLIPAVAAILMSASTVLVAINAQLLRRFGRDRQASAPARTPP